ncbi:uncharacterized protein JCM10292_002043 [Rhodotorula paludigena]|uniref:uncharacterized protein n=1 Tax=Rhodotorula paludigena TaxID=86838 RepID=UPI00316FC376
MAPAQSSRAPFDARAAAELLQRAFQAELDAVHRPTQPGQPSAEVYKPKTPAAGGAWGSGAAVPKPGAMADGRPFLQVLAASFDKAKQQ